MLIALTFVVVTDALMQLTDILTQIHIIHFHVSAYSSHAFVFYAVCVICAFWGLSVITSWIQFNSVPFCLYGTKSKQKSREHSGPGQLFTDYLELVYFQFTETHSSCLKVRNQTKTFKHILLNGWE